MKSVLFAVFHLFSTQPQAPIPPNPDLAAVVQAEKAFAEISRTVGIRAAFMANLAEVSIVFRPGPVDGREAYQDSPNIPGMLQWTPIFADVSSAGDLGYTTGPWVFRDPETDRSVYGHYVTVWKKQPDGAWKLVIDAGVSHPGPVQIDGDVEFPSTSAATATADDTPTESLLEADRSFSAAAAADGFLAALLARGFPTTRVYRQGVLPLIGPPAIQPALAENPDQWRWEPDGGDAARSADLGYTYGIARAPENPTEPGAVRCYLRIWKRAPQGDWKVVVDLSTPLRE